MRSCGYQSSGHPSLGSGLAEPKCTGRRIAGDFVRIRGARGTIDVSLEIATRLWYSPASLDPESRPWPSERCTRRPSGATSGPSRRMPGGFSTKWWCPKSML